MADESSASAFLRPLVGQLIVTLIVGLASGWLGSTTALARFDERIKVLEKKSEEASDTKERLVRVETKLDILMESTIRD